MIEQRKKRVRASAFTLVELLLVITIIGILAGAVVVRFRGVATTAKINRAKTDIGTLEAAISMFEVETGEIPSQEDGLEALYVDPGISGWREGGYLAKKSIKDPWGNDYIYEEPGQRNVDFDIYSMGADEQEGTEDDVGNWEEEEE